jgi:diphthamide biosynthesis protein 4
LNSTSTSQTTTEPLTNGSMTQNFSPTHYEILGLSYLQDEPSLSVQTLRGAYRRALLRWHPDKAHTLITNENLNSAKEIGGTSNRNATQEAYSIDQISKAYSVLSNVKERKAYDEEMKKETVFAAGTNGENKKFKTGVEVVDLDDLAFDEGKGIWYRGCRCARVMGRSLSGAEDAVFG